MTELIAVVLAALPVIVLVALVLETLRPGAVAGEHPPVDLLYRAYGA